METIAQTIPLSAGDVRALEVYRVDGHLVLAVLDRKDDGFPLIQAQLTEKESYALLKALFTEIVSKPLPEQERRSAS